MAAAYNDGSLPYGAQTLNINAVVYVAETVDFTRPTKKIKRYNQLGEPAGQVFVSDFDTGTATIQLQNSSVALPPRGMTFNVVFQATNTNCVVSDVGTPQSQDDTYKCRISFDRVYN